MGGGSSLVANLSGLISKSSSGGCEINTRVYFTVRDNGEGQNAPPDQFTPPCGMDGGGDSERGNIVVTGGEAAN